MAELEKKIKTLEVAGLWNTPGRMKVGVNTLDLELRPVLFSHRFYSVTQMSRTAVASIRILAFLFWNF